MSCAFRWIDKDRAFDLPIAVADVCINTGVTVENETAGVDLDIVKLPVEVRLRQAVGVYPAIEVIEKYALKIKILL